MKFIEKSKTELIKEMYINRGQMEGSALQHFFDSISSLGKRKKIIKSIRDYFQNVVGLDEKELTDDYIEEYVNELTMNIKKINQYFPKIMKNMDVISNLAYHLCEKFSKMKDGVGVKYARINIHGYNDVFYFFDPELEELFGYISVEDVEDKEPVSYCPTRNLKKVNVSMTDKELRGTGLGKNMYFTLIEKFGCLASDASLFSGSLNIWVNILPKNYKVYYYTDDSWSEEGSVVPLTNKKPNYRDIEYFIAIK